MQKKFALLLLLAAAGLGLTGCFNKPEEKPAETTNVPAPVVEEKVPVSNKIDYNAELINSSVQWSASKKVIKTEHTGTVKIKEGKLSFDGQTLVGGNFVLDMTTINDEDQKGDMKTKLEEHLKSADFFDTMNFQTAELIIKTAAVVTDVSSSTSTATSTVATSTEVLPKTYNVTADLTIKGVTQPVEFPAIVKLTDSKVEADANITIDRTKWGIKYGSGQFFSDLGDKVISDEIKFKIKIFADNMNYQSPVTTEPSTSTATSTQ